MKNIYVKTIVCLTFLMGVVAQAQTVSGLVTSDDGPLPGATIVVKGTNNGTTADFDGNFSISAGADDVLVVSFVGFATQEVAVGGQDQIAVTLAADNELEEVVVTGYGSQRSKEITSRCNQCSKWNTNTKPRLLIYRLRFGNSERGLPSLGSLFFILDEVIV